MSEASERYTELALMRVNQVRTTLGYPPLEEFQKGKVQHDTECPIALAFKDIVSGITVEPGYIGFDDPYMARIFMETWGTRDTGSEGGTVVIHTPPEILAFADEFDEGRIPELIADA